jgi:hypothetical protein
MNPYLEQDAAWHDFHESFMPVAREFLSAQLLPRYFVKIDEHIYIHELSDDQQRLSYLEVRDKQNRTLIAVLELLSPTNKRPGPDGDQYVNKREQLLASRAHIVEIDLLRGGPACRT